MIKTLLLSLLLVPTLCFAKLGDTREENEYKYGSPVSVQVYSAQTQMARYLDPDGDTLVVVVYYVQRSVAETYFSKTNKPFSISYMQAILALYSQDWVPFKIEDSYCRCVKSEDTGFFRVCYGPLENSTVKYALTVIDAYAEKALIDIGPVTPYKKSNGLRL